MKINESLTVIATLLLIFFVAKAIYDDQILKEYLFNFRLNNKELRIKNEIQEGDLKYFETPQFKDLYAKENLNLLQKGEKVMIIKQEELKIDFIEKAFGQRANDNVENYPIKKQWRIYFNLDSI